MSDYSKKGTHINLFGIKESYWTQKESFLRLFNPKKSHSTLNQNLRNFRKFLIRLKFFTQSFSHKIFIFDLLHESKLSQPYSINRIKIFLVDKASITNALFQQHCTLIEHAKIIKHKETSQNDRKKCETCLFIACGNGKCLTRQNMRHKLHTEQRVKILY